MFSEPDAFDPFQTGWWQRGRNGIIERDIVIWSAIYIVRENQRRKVFTNIFIAINIKTQQLLTATVVRHSRQLNYFCGRQ